jgi:FtsZ-binding cell division protein ZapB
MNRIETLEQKIRQAAELITALRQEKQKLKEELAFLEEENRKTRQLMQENGTLREQKKTATDRIEGILKKLDSLNV